MTRRAYLDPWRDLQVGLATAASFQTSIRHADTKAVALLTVEGAVAAAIVDRALDLRTDGGPSIVAFAAVLGATFVLGLAAATWHLLLAFRPRLEGGGRHNRFGFPSLVRSGGRPSMASARRQREEVWDFVVTLAHIAMAKHQRIRQSMPWLVMALASAGCLMIVVTLAQLP
ncbi:Pycsar system effector family protein [Micromonospora tulbaghiae]|uniref:Pycsar system effector family protein n=1 Tax=Micromonospora tulbaghiae TaxID=479978 RepID=UPI0036D20435